MDENSLKNIRKKVDSYVGQQVKITANRGRRRNLVKEGILKNTHSNVFVISLNTQNRCIAYSYSDVLINKVEIKIKGEQTKIGTI